MYDGTLKFDTKIDSDAFQNGLGKLQKAATVAFAAIGAASAAAIKSCVTAGMSFESAMSKVSAISGATGDDLARLEKKAKEMGASTVFSATESAEALTYMAMAGWKTEDMLGGISGIIELAAASGEDLASTADIVTDALTAFGLSAEDSAHFADVLAAASSNANTNVSMMGATFKYAAPLAGALGYSIEDVALATGLMANAGIKAEQAGTALRSTFTRLSKPPKETESAMNALNISIQNTDGSAKPLRETLGDLRRAFADLTETEKTQRAAQIAGQEAMSGLLAIVNASDDDFDKLAASIDNANGATKRMADQMVDNLQGDLTLMKSAMEGVKIAVYDSLDEPLRHAAQAAAEAFAKIEQSITSGELAPRIEKIGKQLAAFVDKAAEFAIKALPVILDGLITLAEHLDVIAGLIIGMQIGKMLLSITQMAVQVGVMTRAISSATAAQWGFNAAMAANPIGAVITAIGVLIGLVGVGLVKAYKDAKESSDGLTESIRKANKEYDAAIEQAEEHKNATLADAEKVEILTKKMLDLDDEVRASNELLPKNADEVEKNKKKRDELKSAVEELKKQIPGLVIELDDETGALKTERGEVEKLTQAYKDLAIAKAYQSYYQDKVDALVKKKVDLENSPEYAQYQKAQEAAKELQKRVPGMSFEDAMRAATEVTSEQLKDAWYAVPAKFGEKVFSFLDDGTENSLNGMTAEAFHNLAYKKTSSNPAYTVASELDATNKELDDTLSLLAEYAAKGDGFDREINGLLNGGTGGGGGSGGGGTGGDDEDDENDDSTTTTTTTSSGGETPQEKELRNLKYLRDMDEISAREYCDRLKKYRDDYYEEGSAEYQEYSKEIHRLEQEFIAQEVKQRFDALERKKTRGEITEEQYYEQLAALRDEYYTEGEDEYEKYTDKIIQYQNKVAEAEKQAARDSVNAFAERAKAVENEIIAFSDRVMGEVQQKINAMRSKLDAVAQLTVQDGGLADLKDATWSLREYQWALGSIKERMKDLGIGEDTAQAFFSEMAGMAVDEGKELGFLLMEKSDAQLKQYFEDFAKNREVAAAVADYLYSDEEQRAADEVADYIKTAFENLGAELPSDFFDSGEASAKQFGEGFKAELQGQLLTIQSELATFRATITAGLYGDATVPVLGGGGSSTNNTYNTYNIVNPSGSVTEGLEAAATAAEVDRQRNG